MPELPEVETIVRGLEPELRGQEIEKIELLTPSLQRRRFKNEYGLENVRARRILGIRRRGKMILFECEGGHMLVFHLKMTGQLVFCDKNDIPDKHTHLIITLIGQKRELRFRDVRKFGFLICHPSDSIESCPELAVLGPEPLEMTSIDFAKQMRKRKGRLKSLLLDQRFVAGIGNIYADEILFEARIHPETPASALSRGAALRLWEAIRLILESAIASMGSTLRDYRDAEGRRGEFQSFHKVYDREGDSCLSCGTPIRRIRLGGRSTFFCPKCQRKRRVGTAKKKKQGTRQS